MIKETRRRYNAARLAPTFNRGYDIEEHIVTHVHAMDRSLKQTSRGE